MQGGYQIRDQNGIYFITFVVVEWVDVFTRKDYANLVVESLQYCQKGKGLITYAWCLMPNHLHLIVSAADGFALSAILRDFKKFTSAAILNAPAGKPAKLDVMAIQGRWRKEQQKHEIPVLAAE
jgi:putative transposase